MKFILILLFLVQVTFSQALIMRNLTATPLDSNIKNGFFPKMIFAAEANDGFGSVDEEQKWNIKFNAVIGLYKWSNNMLLTTMFSNELVSNTFSDISFNPRGVMWNETISLFVLHKYFHMEYGITHQCKHDIDNLSPPNNDAPPGNRVVVLTGLYSGIVSKKIEVLSDVNVRSYFKLHYYLFSDDEKIPENTVNKNWKDIAGAFYTGIKTTYDINDSFTLYNKNWFNLVYFDSDVLFENNYHVETGVSIKGIIGDFDMYFAYEKFFDDVSRPFTQRNNVNMIGIRLRNNLFI